MDVEVKVKSEWSDTSEEIDVVEQFIDGDQIQDRKTFEKITTIKKEENEEVGEMSPPNEKKFKCPHCEYSADKMDYLKNHIRCIHVNSKPHKCSVCEYSANQRKYVKIHMRKVHLLQKEYTYTCKHCDFVTHEAVMLKRHENSAHLKKEYNCLLCDYAAKVKHYVTQHVEAVHLAREYKCTLCDYVANQSTHLKRHVDSVHLQDKPHKCHLCQYAANQKSNLKRHLKTHETKGKRK